jgi:membrane protease YdiL (CAAX protease family)
MASFKLKKKLGDDTKSGSWGPVSSVLIATFVFFSSQVAVGLILQEYILLRHWSRFTANWWLSNSVAALFVETFLVELFVVLILYAFLRKRKISFKDIGLRGKFLIRDLSYALGGFFTYLLVYFSAVTTLQFFVKSFNVSQKQNLGVPSTAQGNDLWLLFIMLVVLPPIAEEILFRGFIYTSLRPKMNKVIAAIITSLLFALPHLFESNSGILWIAGCDTFILSMVLVYVREKTDKLWASMLIHALKNFIAFASLYLMHTG